MPKLATATLVWASLCWTPISGTASAADLTVVVAGPSSVVYDSARDACAPIDVPDINARAFRDAAGRVTLFALHYVNRALRGADLDHLKIDCHVVLDSPFDADPAHYDDHNYIASTWSTDGTHVSALVHHEYHADQHHRCAVSSALGCWYNSVLAYRSADGGADFTKAMPLVVASAPFTQDVEQGRHRGFFNPSNMFSDNGFVYVLASTTGWTGQEPGSCLFRTTNPADAGAWRAYDGARFTVRFADPYVTKEQPRPCKPIDPFLLPVGSITRHAPSGLWLAVFQAPRGDKYPADGFYYAVGRDLFHWSTPRLLLAGQNGANDLCKVASSIIDYPAVLDAQATGRNFDGIKDDPELFFTIIEVGDCQTKRRLLVRRPLKVTWHRDGR